jgi:hypothetical protein
VPAARTHLLAEVPVAFQDSAAAALAKTAITIA